MWTHSRESTRSATKRATCHISIAQRDAHRKPGLESSCCICLRGCVCLVRQCPFVRIRFSKIQIHNLTRSMIHEYLMKIATMIALQHCTISGFRVDCSFHVAFDFCRFLLWVQYKSFYECCLILFRCLLLRVLFYIGQFQDSPAIIFFALQLFRDFLRFLFDFDKNFSPSMCLISMYLFAIAIPLPHWIFLDSPATPLFPLRSFREYWRFLFWFR